MPARLRDFFGDRIQVKSLLIVLCFVSVLMLSSQSAASYPSYFLALAMLVSFRHWSDVFSTPMIWSILVLLGYLCLTSVWSDPFVWRDALGMIGRGLLVFFFVVAMAECHLRGQVQRWLGRSLAIVGTLAALTAIAVYIIEKPTTGRVSGLGQLDNSVVAGLVFGAVLILLLEILLSDSDRRWKLAAAAGLIVVGVTIYLTGSRNAWMSSTIGALVLLFAWRIADGQRFVVALTAVMMILAVVVTTLLLNDQGRELLLPRGDSFRLEIWSVVYNDVVANALVFGKGILTPDQVEVGGKVFDHPHNMYLAVFFQGGIAASGLFALLIAWCAVELFRNYELRSSKLALGLLCMALISYLLDGHELIDKVGETWFLFWLPVGISLGIGWDRRLRDAQPVEGN